MKWGHSCSKDWLKARQEFLCASDVRRLVPFTKTGRPRKVTNQERLAIWSEKQRRITSDDCISTGAAARGHILEPYAIAEYNSMATLSGWPTLYHWDDVLIRDEFETHHLAFSPDATDMIQASSTPPVQQNSIANIKTIGEVKSYSAEKHVVSMSMPKMALEERWQIATAMAAAPLIDDAYLIFYNPSLTRCNIGVFHYTRLDLSKEIDIVRNVDDDWHTFLHIMESYPFTVGSEATLGKLAGPTEAEIFEMISEKSRLNPR